MFKTDVYREVKSWKKPLYLLRTVLATYYLKLLKNTQIVGVTGSVGKTLTQNAIASVLAQKYKVVVGDENLDPTYRIPQTILKSSFWTQKLVLEYGVEHPGDMTHYLSIARPQIAVVTHISPSHLKYFHNIHGVFDEKSKIVSALPKEGFAVLNADDPGVVKMSNFAVAKVLWFGQKAQDSVKISHFKQNFSGSSFRMHYNGQKATVNWKVVGRQHLVSAYAAASVGIASNLTLKQIAKGLSLTKVPQHRLLPHTKNGMTILDDSYNSSPKAAKESIATLSEIGKGKYKIAVLGEMKDLGEYSKSEHRLLGQRIAKTRINLLVTNGLAAGDIGVWAKKHGFRGIVRNFSDVSGITKFIKSQRSKNSVILVKASRHAHFERIVNGLLDKPTEMHCYHCGDLK